MTQILQIIADFIFLKIKDIAVVYIRENLLHLRHLRAYKTASTLQFEYKEKLSIGHHLIYLSLLQRNFLGFAIVLHLNGAIIGCN